MREVCRHMGPGTRTRIRDFGSKPQPRPPADHLDDRGYRHGVLGQFLTLVKGEDHHSELVVRMQHPAQRAVARDLDLGGDVGEHGDSVGGHGLRLRDGARTKPDGTRILTGNTDTDALWYLEERRPLALEAHTAPITSVALGRESLEESCHRRPKTPATGSWEPTVPRSICWAARRLRWRSAFDTVDTAT